MHDTPGQITAREPGVIDRIILFSLIALVLVLPVAHTITVRSTLQVLPALLWAWKMYRERKLLFERTPLDLPLLLYLIAVIISLFTSLKLSASLEDLRGEFFTYTVGFYVVVNNIRREEDVKAILVTLLLGSVFMAGYGIIDFFRHSSDILSYHYRAGSLHQGYEAYAQYIIMVLPFNLVAFFYRKDLPGRAFLSLVLLINCFALFLTHTRGAWLALWVEMILVSVLVVKRGALKATFIILLLAAPVLSLSVLPSKTIWHGGEGLDTEVTASEANPAEIRLIMWKGFLEEFSNDPFTPAGYGKKNFERRFEEKGFALMEQAHNTFINTATQLGVQGLLALFFIIYTVLRTSAALWRRGSTPFRRHFSMAVLIMTVGFFTANQFAEFYIDDTAQLYWVLTGLLVSLYLLDRRSEGGLWER